MDGWTHGRTTVPRCIQVRITVQHSVSSRQAWSGQTHDGGTQRSQGNGWMTGSGLYVGAGAVGIGQIRKWSVEADMLGGTSILCGEKEKGQMTERQGGRSMEGRGRSEKVVDGDGSESDGRPITSTQYAKELRGERQAALDRTTDDNLRLSLREKRRGSKAKGTFHCKRKYRINTNESKSRKRSRRSIIGRRRVGGTRWESRGKHSRMLRIQRRLGKIKEQCPL